LALDHEAAGALLVDVGNSAIKWAGLGPTGGLTPPGYAGYRAETLDTVLERNWAMLQAPATIWLASVADGAVNTALSAWCWRRWGADVRQVGVEAEAFGVVNGSGDPGQLGIDRWLAVLGARARWPGAACVADLGTAATVEAVDAGGRYLGGYILPGIDMGRTALLAATRIPRIEDVDATGPFGTSTAEAVALGARRALSGVIDHVMRWLTRDGAAARLFLAGSEARAVRDLLDWPVVDAPHLVLEGLALYAERG
jgi:type III pantothenate kinase